MKNKNESTGSSSHSSNPQNFSKENINEDLNQECFLNFDNYITITISVVGLTGWAVEECTTLYQELNKSKDTNIFNNPKLVFQNIQNSYNVNKGGSGKSCLCSRLLHVSEEDYRDGKNHTSYLSPHDFSGRVINNDHFLFWGYFIIPLDNMKKDLKKNQNKCDSFHQANHHKPIKNNHKCSPNAILVRIVEQTEFIDDTLLKPFKAGNKINDEPYYKRCCATKLQSNEKLMYISKDQLGLEHEYEQVLFPNGRVEVDGYVLCCDASYFRSIITNPGFHQISNLPKPNPNISQQLTNPPSLNSINYKNNSRTSQQQPTPFTNTRHKSDACPRSTSNLPNSHNNNNNNNKQRNKKNNQFSIFSNSNLQQPRQQINTEESLHREDYACTRSNATHQNSIFFGQKSKTSCSPLTTSFTQDGIDDSSHFFSADNEYNLSLNPLPQLTGGPSPRTFSFSTTSPRKDRFSSDNTSNHHRPEAPSLPTTHLSSVVNREKVEIVTASPLNASILHLQNKLLDDCLTACCRKGKKPAVIALTKADLLFDNGPQHLTAAVDNKDGPDTYEDDDFLLLLFRAYYGGGGDGGINQEQIQDGGETLARRINHAAYRYEYGNEALKNIKGYVRDRFSGFVPGTVPFIATSAKSNVNVSSPFLALVKLVLKGRGYNPDTLGTTLPILPSFPPLSYGSNTTTLEECATLVDEHTYKTQGVLIDSARLLSLSDNYPPPNLTLSSLAREIPFTTYDTLRNCSNLKINNVNNVTITNNNINATSGTITTFNSTAYRSYITKHLKFPLFREALALTYALKICAHQTLNAFYKRSVTSYDQEPTNFKTFLHQSSSVSNSKMKLRDHHQISGMGGITNPQNLLRGGRKREKRNYPLHNLTTSVEGAAPLNSSGDSLQDNSHHYKSYNVSQSRYDSNASSSSNPLLDSLNLPVELGFGLYILGRLKCAALFDTHRSRLRAKRIREITGAYLDVFDKRILKTLFPTLQSLDNEKSWSKFYLKKLLNNPEFVKRLRGRDRGSDTLHLSDNNNDLFDNTDESAVSDHVIPWYETESARQLVVNSGGSLNRENSLEQQNQQEPHSHCISSFPEDFTFPREIFETELAQLCFEAHVDGLITAHSRKKARVQFAKLLETLSSPPPPPPPSSSFSSRDFSKDPSSILNKYPGARGITDGNYSGGGHFFSRKNFSNGTSNSHKQITPFLVLPVILPGQPLNQITLEKMLTLKACRECLQHLPETDTEEIYQLHQFWLIEKSIFDLKECCLERWDNYFESSNSCNKNNLLQQPAGGGGENSKLFNSNMKPLFNCKFIGPPTPTSQLRGGRRQPIAAATSQIHVNQLISYLNDDIRYRCLDLMVSERLQILGQFLEHLIYLNPEHCFYNNQARPTCTDLIISAKLKESPKFICLENLTALIRALNPRSNEESEYNNGFSSSNSIANLPDQTSSFAKTIKTLSDFDIFVLYRLDKIGQSQFDEFQREIKNLFPDMCLTSYDWYTDHSGMSSHSRQYKINIRPIPLNKDSSNYDLPYPGISASASSSITDASIIQILTALSRTYWFTSDISLHALFILTGNRESPAFTSFQMRNLLLNTFNSSFNHLNLKYEFSDEVSKITAISTLLNVAFVYSSSDCQENILPTTSPQAQQQTIYLNLPMNPSKDFTAQIQPLNNMDHKDQKLHDFSTKYNIQSYVLGIIKSLDFNTSSLDLTSLANGLEFKLKFLRNLLITEDNQKVLLNMGIPPHGHFSSASDNKATAIPLSKYDYSSINDGIAHINLTICLNCGDETVTVTILEKVLENVGKLFPTTTNLPPYSIPSLYSNSTKNGRTFIFIYYNDYDVDGDVTAKEQLPSFDGKGERPPFCYFIVHLTLISYHSAWALQRSIDDESSNIASSLRDDDAAFLLTYDVNREASFNIMSSYLKRLTAHNTNHYNQQNHKRIPHSPLPRQFKILAVNSSKIRTAAGSLSSANEEEPPKFFNKLNSSKDGHSSILLDAGKALAIECDCEFAEIQSTPENNNFPSILQDFIESNCHRKMGILLREGLDDGKSLNRDIAISNNIPTTNYAKALLLSKVIRNENSTSSQHDSGVSGSNLEEISETIVFETLLDEPPQRKTVMPQVIPSKSSPPVNDHFKLLKPSHFKNRRGKLITEQNKADSVKIKLHDGHGGNKPPSYLEEFYDDMAFMDGGRRCQMADKFDSVGEVSHHRFGILDLPSDRPNVKKDNKAKNIRCRVNKQYPYYPNPPKKLEKEIKTSINLLPLKNLNSKYLDDEYSRDLVSCSTVKSNFKNLNLKERLENFYPDNNDDPSSSHENKEESLPNGHLKAKTEDHITNNKRHLQLFLKSTGLSSTKPLNLSKISGLKLGKIFSQNGPATSLLPFSSESSSMDLESPTTQNYHVDPGGKHFPPSTSDNALLSPSSILSDKIFASKIEALEKSKLNRHQIIPAVNTFSFNNNKTSSTNDPSTNHSKQQQKQLTSSKSCNANFYPIITPPIPFSLKNRDGKSVIPNQQLTTQATLFHNKQQHSKDVVLEAARNQIPKDCDERIPTEINNHNHNLVHRQTSSELLDVVMIPEFLRICLEYIESEGYNCEGIYRIPGSKNQVDQLMKKLSQDKNFLTTTNDDIPLNAVGTAVKTYLSDQPEALFPPNLITEMLEIGNMIDMSDKVTAWFEIFEAHKNFIKYDLIKFFIHHLYRISQHKDVNFMSSRNLAICFWPTLTRPDFTDYESMALSAKPLEEALYVLIEHFYDVFT